MTTEAERRHIYRLIDLAVERCEEGNLRERLEVPRWVAELVVQLQAAARRPLSVPGDTITAHGQLLELREGYMNCRREGADEELEEEPDEGQRDDNLCASCGSPLSPLSRYSTCSPLSTAAKAGGESGGGPGLMIEVVPIGSRVPCACPRHLITEELRGRITRRPDGRIHFPPAARHVALQVEHRTGCPAAPTEHEHWNVSSDGWIYRCSICGLERTNIEIAAEMRERSGLRAIS